MRQLDSASGGRRPLLRAAGAAGSGLRFAWLGVALVAVCGWMPPRAIGAETPKAAPPASQLMLDGRSFRVEAFEKGKKAFDDRLVFKDGTFFSESCRKLGFSESPYYVRMVGDQIEFFAETVSPTHGTMVWKGAVKQNRIDGGFRWTKERWYWTVLRNFDVKGTGGK